MSSRRNRRSIVAAALTGAACAAGVSAVLAGQPQVLRPGPPPVVAGAELVVTGVNHGDRPLALWVRADGPASQGFSSRANLFRAAAPGPFRFWVNRADLRTPGGSPLELGADPAVRVFAHDGAEGLSDLAVRWIAPPSPPAGVMALDFGPRDGAVFPGFAPADETAAAVQGRRIVPVDRPGADALARDGLAGVEAITLAPPPGRYLVKLWLEDLGAWEHMPHALRHRVRINGRTVLDRTDTHESWVRSRWLAGADRAHVPGDDAWTAFGARRAGLPAETVDIGPEGLRIELAGDAPGAVFVAALAVVPEAEAAWLDAVAHAQAERFRARWPIDATPDSADFDASARTLTLAPGAVGWVRIDAGVAGAVALRAPRLGDAALPATLRLGSRRLDRPSPNSPHLAPLARAFHAALPSPAPDPLGRPALVEVRAPADAAPGRYSGALVVAGEERHFAVEIVAATLPPFSGPVGVYLADPPHHRWFRTDALADRACRLATLAGMGLTGVAPPLATPTPDGRAAFAADLAVLRAALPAGPHLAYQEAQRLFDALPPDAAVAALAAAHALAPELVWSLADEPSNPDPHGRSLAGHVGAIRAAAPGVRLAAQLNAPADRALAPLFDVALVNPGFGIDAGDLDALAGAGVEAWIYNTGPERLAAGFYAWRVGAAGFLQWHAMMPTADPFDPTDGREGDALLLPPSADPCAAVPPIDDRLARIAEGAADRRWLAWLDARAVASAPAAALRARLMREIPDAWAEARSRLTAADLDRLRAAIAALVEQGEG